MTSESEAKEFVDLHSAIQAKAESAIAAVEKVIKKFKDGTINVGNRGLSFYDLKNNLMADYVANLALLMQFQTRGKMVPENSDPVVLRIAENRTVLERMRPLEKKLKYQTDKLVRCATNPVYTKGDSLKFRANPSNFISKSAGVDDEYGEDEIDSDMEGGSDDDDEGDSAGAQKGEKKAGVYRPPKLAPAHFTNVDKEEREQNDLKKARKKALSSSILQELQEEYDEAPIEIRELADVRKAKLDKEARARTDYEEDNFTRVNLTKKDKQRLKDLQGDSNLNAITSFGDYSALDEGSDEDENPEKSSKDRGGFGGKRKKEGGGRGKGRTGFKKSKRR